MVPVPIDGLGAGASDGISVVLMVALSVLLVELSSASVLVGVSVLAWGLAVSVVPGCRCWLWWLCWYGRMLFILVMVLLVLVV